MATTQESTLVKKRSQIEPICIALLSLLCLSLSQASLANDTPWIQNVYIKDTEHAHIQDVFSEYNVQMMSAHYLGAPEKHKVVLKEDTSVHWQTPRLTSNKDASLAYH
ncbi:hypothetical protein [Undibacterium sp.]|uniref:hypothetical protein n=1 Tax=Undibacterium sp. TaxID=1914977 RepID=UPI003753A308